MHSQQRTRSSMSRSVSKRSGIVSSQSKKSSRTKSPQRPRNSPKNRADILQNCRFKRRVYGYMLLSEDERQAFAVAVLAIQLLIMVLIGYLEKVVRQSRLVQMHQYIAPSGVTFLTVELVYIAGCILLIPSVVVLAVVRWNTTNDMRISDICNNHTVRVEYVLKFFVFGVVPMFLLYFSMSRMFALKDIRATFAAENPLSQYLRNSTVKDRLDSLQTYFACCGVENYQDWQDYLNDDLKKAVAGNLWVPFSCCRINSDNNPCIPFLPKQILKNIYNSSSADYKFLSKNIHIHGCVHRYNREYDELVSTVIIIFSLADAFLLLSLCLLRILRVSIYGGLVLGHSQLVCCGWAFGPFELERVDFDQVIRITPPQFCPVIPLRERNAERPESENERLKLAKIELSVTPTAIIWKSLGKATAFPYNGDPPVETKNEEDKDDDTATTD